MANAAASRKLNDELKQLVETYRHLHEEHRRTGTNSRTRRRLEQRLAAAAERFERRLREAALDEQDREEWRRHIYHAAPPPALAENGTPIVFRGRSDTGSELLIRRLGPGELEVIVDGTTVERLAEADELLSLSPNLTFPMGGQLYRETFQVEEGALDNLAELLATGKPVPGLQALVREGLVSRNLELTPRGRRALDRTKTRGGMPGERGPIEIVVRGRVGDRSRDRLRTALDRIAASAPRSVLFVRGTLTREENPSLARPAVAEATLNLSGRVTRATARGSDLGEAIDLLVERLNRAMRELRRTEEAERREPGVSEPGSWRHGNLPSHPPRTGTRRRP